MEAISLLREAAARAWQPLVFVPGPLAGPALYELPGAFDRRVFLAYPTVPADRSPDAQAAYDALLGGVEATQAHRPAQFKALACATVLMEGLRRCGRRVDRHSLVRALEELREFPTRFHRPVTFGPNRRVGAPGAYVVTVDLRRNGLIPSSALVLPR